MQRRIEKPHDDRQPVHGLEHAEEIACLGLQQLVHSLVSHGGVFVQNERLNDLLAIAQEHMLGTAQTDALGAEVAGEFRVLRVVGIGAHAERAEFVGPLEDGVEVARHLG